MKFYRNQVLLSIDNPSLQENYLIIDTFLRQELAKQNLDDEINVLDKGSLGFAGTGVSMMIYPEQVTYINITKADIPEIVREHFIKGLQVNRLLMEEAIKPFKRAEKRRIVLENSGIIDPENIDEYLAVGGYEAWEKANAFSPEDSFEEVKKNSAKLDKKEQAIQLLSEKIEALQNSEVIEESRQADIRNNFATQLQALTIFFQNSSLKETQKDNAVKALVDKYSEYNDIL